MDDKLVRRYHADPSKWARLRRKRVGLANVAYLRFGRTFVLVATHGLGEFFEAEGGAVRDARQEPFRVGGYAVGFKGGPRLGADRPGPLPPGEGPFARHCLPAGGRGPFRRGRPGAAVRAVRRGAEPGGLPAAGGQPGAGGGRAGPPSRTPVCGPGGGSSARSPPSAGDVGELCRTSRPTPAGTTTARNNAVRRHAPRCLGALSGSGLSAVTAWSVGMRDALPPCPRCGATHVVRNGLTRAGSVNLLCRGCGRRFPPRPKRPPITPEKEPLVRRHSRSNSIRSASDTRTRVPK